MCSTPYLNKMNDSEAKAKLRTWSTRTNIWPVDQEKQYWLRAYPKSGSETCPKIHSPGAELFKTQPDGLWVYIKEGVYVDAICVEVCNSTQNLNDKRSRYIPSNHSLLITFPLKWMKEQIDLQRGSKCSRWEACGTILNEPDKDIRLPIRFLRVLYSLSPKFYKDWTANHIPAGYEYFCRHTSLESFTSNKMQIFLKQLSMKSHFYTKG